MTHRLTQLTRLMAGYSLASYIGPIFTIILTPLYTRILLPSDYAQLDVLTTLSGLAGSLASLGLGSAVAVHFYEGDDTQRANLLATATAIGLAWATLVALILGLSALPLASLLLGSSQASDLLLVAALAVPLTTIGLVMQTGLRLTMQVARSNILALVNLLLTVIFNIALVLWLRQGVWGIQTTLLLTACWTALGGWLLLRTIAWGKLDQSMLQPLLRAGVGALPGVLALWALGYFDRLLLPLYGVPADQRGLYAIAAKLASMLAVVIVPFQVAWVPLALSMRDEPQAEQTYARVLSLFTAGALGLALVVALFAREILLVFTTQAYLGAAPFVAPLIYTTVANGLMICLGIGAALRKRTEVTGISLLIGALINLLLNIVLIPRFGVWGAAWATLVGYAVVPLLVYVWSQRIQPIAYHPWSVLAILAVQVMLLLIGLNIPLVGLASIAARLGLLVAYVIMLFVMRVVTLAEIRSFLARIHIISS